MTDRPQLFWGHDDDRVEALLDGPMTLSLTFDTIEPTAVHGALGYAVGPEIEALYGPAIMEAVYVAAVNLETGGHASGTIAPALAVPAVNYRPKEPPDIATLLGEDEQVGEPSAAEMVGFDLTGILGIPADGGTYALFAWLDDLVSPVVVVDMPDAGASPLVPNQPPHVSILTHHTKVENLSYLPEAQTLLVPESTGPLALFILEGATRRVTSHSWDKVPAGPITIDLAAQLEGQPPSPYSSRLLVFRSGAVEQLVLP